jgi:hypothetical protein
MLLVIHGYVSAARHDAGAPYKSERILLGALVAGARFEGKFGTFDEAPPWSLHWN